MACPLCDGVADRFGDHAQNCPCGGDRTKRHNRLRSVLAAKAHAAGFHPEVEKPSLLPPRSGWRRMGVGASAPADLHGPAALDLTVTARLRHGTLHHFLSEAHKPVWDYEARKCSHLQTQELCSAQGIQFVPLAVESRGCRQKPWPKPLLFSPGRPCPWRPVGSKRCWL